jgi:hypothetical protein
MKNDKNENKALSQTSVIPCFSFDEFNSKLKELGFEVKIEKQNDRDFRFRLEMNGLNISGNKYPLFGMYCGGNYNSCSRSNQELFSQKDLEDAVKHCSEILMNEIRMVNEIPNYHTCKDFFRENPPKKKIEIESIDRVFNLIKENYNDIIHFYRSTQNKV